MLSLDEMRKVAGAAARRYARRCWWASEEDLRQEAWLAVLSAGRSFDPAFGVPERAYAWAAAVRHLSGVLWRESAPVSAGSSDRRGLAGQHRAPLSPGLRCPLALPDERLAEERRRARVRERFRELDAGGDAALAERVLLGEQRPRHVAAELGTPVAEVYAATARTRRRLGADHEMFALWREEP